MLKKISLFLILPLFFLATLGFWWLKVIQAPSKKTDLQRVVITKGSSAAEIGKELWTAGVIKNAFAFKFYVQLTGVSKKIQAGQYSLPANKTLFQVVKELLSGPSQIWVTIPEGLRREEIGERFIQAFELKDEEEKAFNDQFLKLTSSQEGYLFPDTYLFAKDASASAVVSALLNTFEKRMASIPEDDLQESNLSQRQIIVLASILERETITNEERPIVAGILIKRWQKGWALQADATVQYVLGEPGNWWPRPLTKTDLETNSSYNTYKYTGLPQGPICNPGLISIKAVVYAEDSPYWFYLHDSEGKIHYAEILEEHNLNVAKYLGK